ncbi:MAG TPA: cation-transporting P-type ATPase [Blastocatellia bacterium]|nr:cation-transporting P-type ATPase [Blastocatellia bacterium]HMZ20150.1 cation-transporting P-type ATPase [Blastocatellia bacterium]HNG32493.1 cation-transporting P-type ATPase [Blastocatellia bacterium]
MTTQTAALTGLTSAEALARLQQHGPNALPDKPATPWWRRFLRQFKSPLIYILLVALAIDLAIWISEGASGVPAESVAIAVILLLNAVLGVYQENKSEAALARLREMAAPLVWVLRDGELKHLPGSELVPGDAVRIEAGDRVPADGKLLEAEGAMVDESVLTGESLPIEKASGEEVFSGTMLVRGKSYFEVSRTGEQSAMGRLAVMIGGIQAEQTPLEKRLEKFGNQVARAVLALVVLIVAGGLLAEGVGRLSHVFLFGVALAVAAVPEGLPAVLTLTLALGVERMAKRKAVVRRLSAVEALGSITVIATDKTGTLTENRMFVRDLDSPETKRALLAMTLANDAEESSGAGDPLELALLDYAQKHGLEPARLKNDFPRQSSRPFDSLDKFMRVTVRENGGLASYLKGAPEVVLQRSRLTVAERGVWEEKAEGYAREGYRVLALAACAGEAETELDFLGLVLLWDPPRPEVPEAIRRAREAGIRVVMITGDHPATALAVAHEVGIASGRVLTGLEMEELPPDALREAVKETNIFARVAPEHKLRLVEALKQNGEIVAMTGDGVNDAPALKRSDVGVAMGDRGSDVAREVADLVLLDDNFATIVAAIEEGRSIYENIQKFIRFLFSANLALVLLVIGGSAGAFWLGLREADGGLLLPLTAIQLLWINVITNGAPAVALGFDKNTGVMLRGPRHPQAPLLDRASLRFVLTSGVIQAVIGGVLLAVLPQFGHDKLDARGALFLYATLSQLFYAYPSRRLSVLPKFNGALHLAVGLGVVLQLLTILLPGLRTMLGIEVPELRLALLVLGAVLLTWGAVEVYSRIACQASAARA